MERHLELSVRAVGTSASVKLLPRERPMGIELPMHRLATPLRHPRSIVLVLCLGFSLGFSTCCSFPFSSRSRPLFELIFPYHPHKFTPCEYRALATRSPVMGVCTARGGASRYVQSLLQELATQSSIPFAILPSHSYSSRASVTDIPDGLSVMKSGPAGTALDIEYLAALPTSPRQQLVHLPSWIT
jgi:hypothetical protein